MKLKKVLPAIAVLVGTSIGAIGGYYYHSAESSPAFLSLSTALELVTGREAKAQAAYESAQSKLAVLQEAVIVQAGKHRSQLAAIHGRRERAELTLRPALAESNRRVALAEVATIPPPIIIPDDPEADCLKELLAAAAWEALAETRLEAIAGLQKAQERLLDINEVLMLEVGEEQRYRFTVEQSRDLWKERYELAGKRVSKLKGSRLKWTLGMIAGAAAGIYLSGR